MEADKILPLSHRPKKSGSATRKKQHVVTFRASSSDLQAIESAAEEEGLTRGSYIREMLLKSPETRKRRRPLADMAVLPRLLGELNRSGGNINQIARRINLGETPLAAELRGVLEAQREAVAAIRTALGLGGK
jgi:hypothetical protein